MKPTFMSLLKADATREQLEEWCRGQTQSYPVPLSGGTKMVCRVLGKYIMCCQAADSALTPHLVLNGIWEPWITMAIARHVKPGMRCMDVGACYGYYALLMADIVGETGYVQAWDPAWGGVASLNAQLNGLPIEVLSNAMTSEPTRLELLPPSASGFFNAGDIKLVPESTSKLTLKRRGAAPVAKTWDFIKIDVEGAEADVWQALAGVREVSPHLTVCMEFTPSKVAQSPEDRDTPGKHDAPRHFLEQIQADGFALGTVGSDGVPRACSLEEAIVPDTGDFRMLWLTRRQ